MPKRGVPKSLLAVCLMSAGIHICKVSFHGEADLKMYHGYEGFCVPINLTLDYPKLLLVETGDFMTRCLSFGGFPISSHTEEPAFTSV